MGKASFYLLISCMTLMQGFTYAAENDAQSAIEKPQPFESFTGKITKNRVRVRLQANTESPILRELNKNDLVVVTAESEDFYTVQAPSDVKAFIYRTFVLDNVVEGTRVNIRLEPNTEAPVLAQMNSGDLIEGVVSNTNSKWMEIKLPSTVEFYVSKDFIEKIGNASLLKTLSQRREEVTLLLDSARQISLTELQKSFPEINLEGVTNNLNKVVSDYPELPEQVEKAKALLTLTQDHYIQKKIAYLESQMKTIDLTLLRQETMPQTQTFFGNVNLSEEPSVTNSINARSPIWEAAEDKLFATWQAEHPELSKAEFDQSQKSQAKRLVGTLEVYELSVKNKPGDYLLISQSSNRPIAYLYSTEINLEDHVGKDVVLEAIERDNNHFAFPAYNVLTIQ